MNRRASLFRWGIPTRRDCLPIAAFLGLLAGCAGPSPFQPAPVRFGQVEFLESLDAPGSPVEIRLSRDAFAPDDALVATVLLDKSLVGKERSARLAVLGPTGTAAATLEIADLRNPGMLVHVHLRSAPPGRYLLRIETGSHSGEKPFSVTR